MIISHAKKFIFVHNPKCAGTAFRALVASHHDHAMQFWGIDHKSYFQRDTDYAHLRLWELAVLYPEVMRYFETYNSVAFVRNPFQRFLSAISEHFKQYRPSENLLDCSAAKQLLIVENFIDAQLTTDRIHADFRYVHFSPQSWFLNLGMERKVKHVLPILDDGKFGRHGLDILGLPAAPLKPRNVMEHDLSALLESKLIRAFVLGFYRRDFLLLHDDATLRPVIFQSSAQPEMEDLLPIVPALQRPAAQPRHARRLASMLKPRRLMRRSVKRLRRAFKF